MDELVKDIAEKTGIPEEVARQVVDLVIAYLKERLPDPLAAQLDHLLAGGDLSQVEDLLSGLGGLFGR